MAIAIALIRGFAPAEIPTIGNFWVDIVRCMLYMFLPIAFIGGIMFVGAGRDADLRRRGRACTTP